jgi:hypothetical protein
MTRKTRKHHTSLHNLKKQHTYAKNGTKIKCLMKTCRANKYKAVYGSSGGSIRSNISLFY